MSDILKELARIQQALKAPKSQYNEFGNFHYRSCEDILEAVKPLLGDCVLILSDEVLNMGDRYYIEATAELRLSEDAFYRTTAIAREAESKKGMDASQITGAASSYARKYALNGLFLIDDTRDADTHEPEKKEELNRKFPTTKHINLDQRIMIDDLIVESGTDRDAFKKYYKIENVKELSASRFAEAVDFLKRKIEGGKDDK
jgi:hypothetical protein